MLEALFKFKGWLTTAENRFATVEIGIQVRHFNGATEIDSGRFTKNKHKFLLFGRKLNLNLEKQKKCVIYPNGIQFAFFPIENEKKYRLN